ncbi:hypothetical protein BDZ89DRAFT_945157 [Hymenopellis radicata]|nr:hypothetical protein BDZ89DRAFT_945157 [Hymenopellis radicata]
MVGRVCSTDFFTDADKLIRVCRDDHRSILDIHGHRASILVGSPPVQNWSDLATQACRDMTEIQEKLTKHRETSISRRGEYYSCGVGITANTRSSKPHNFANSAIETALLRDLLDRKAFEIMGEYSSDTLRDFYPDTWLEYDDCLASVISEDPTLMRLYERCCFAACHINFPPDAWTRFHLDTMNLRRGMCAVWALGNYDSTRGGHLILWDLGVIVEFPPGNMILLPSALVVHGNFAIIQDGVIRGAFVLYSAGCLFKYVYNRRGQDLDASFGIAHNLAAFPVV